MMTGFFFIIFWHNYIYEAFSDFKYTKKEAFKRKYQAKTGVLKAMMPSKKA